MTKKSKNLRPNQSLWQQSRQQLLKDRWGILGLIIVVFYLLIVIGVWFGFWGTEWSTISDNFNQAPSLQHWFGTNAIGQDIAERGIYATQVAFEVGVVVMLFSILLGVILGALAGFFNNTWIDGVLLWLMGVIDAIPFYLLVAAVAFAMQGHEFAMHIAMIAVFWTTTARLIRAEVIKLKQLAFVEAATAIGFNPAHLLFRHIIPNTNHLIIIQASIVFISAIKTEVILSFLGLGIKEGISWGLMIAEATNDIQAGYFNNFIAASLLLFILVIGFNLFSDAIQDALDPKLQKNP